MGWGDETRTLTQEISTSHELRKEDLKQMQEDTRAFLTQTGSELKEMSARLKVDLAKVKPTIAREEADRTGQAKTDLKQRQADVKDMINQVAKLLSDLNATHKDMSTRLKADLAREETDRVKQAQIMIKERVTAVDELLGEVKAEKGKAAAAWLELVNVMQAEPAKKEAMAKAEPVEMATPETTALNSDHDVLVYLADHPDGTRMTELEEEFGVARIRMARLLKELMNENKAEKRDMLYSAI